MKILSNTSLETLEQSAIGDMPVLSALTVESFVEWLESETTLEGITLDINVKGTSDFVVNAETNEDSLEMLINE